MTVTHPAGPNTVADYLSSPPSGGSSDRQPTQHPHSPHSPTHRGDTMTSDVREQIAAIRAQLDEDERVAKAASPGPWDHGGDGLVWPPRIGDPVSGSTEPEDAEHIARWHPPRVLALTAALRQALDEFHGEAREYEVVVLLARALYADQLGFPEGWLR